LLLPIWLWQGGCSAREGRGPLGPEIAVKQGATVIEAGRGHYDFGSVPVGTSSVAVVFTIGNTGEENLVVSSIALSGADAAEFQVTTAVSSVPGGSSGTFHVTFSPASVGKKTAQVSVVSNDADENPYVFAVSGTGTGVAGGLTSTAEIEAATFVELDFAGFPTLPAGTIPAHGALYVATTGSDATGDGSPASPYRTITNALRRCAAGSTIVVEAGVYAESDLEVNKPQVTVMAVPGQSVTVTPTGTNRGFLIAADQTTIRGLTIRGFDQVGVLIEGNPRRGLIVADSVITGSAEGIASWDEGVVDGLLVYNTTIAEASLIGMHCGNGTGNHWRIEKVRILMSGADGDSGADALAVEHGDDILLVNDELTGASADGIDTKATDVVVIGCHVHQVGRNGIKLWYGGDVVNTLVHHTGADAAIVTEYGPKVRLLHSTVAYHNYDGGPSYGMTFGYDSQSPQTVEIINSVVFNTSGGAYVNPHAALLVSHSLFFGMQSGVILWYGDETVSIADGAPGLNPFGPANLVTDPRLDAEYRPRAGSPVIDAGVVLTTDFPRKDQEGNPRILGNAPDLGPFETQ